MNEISERQPLSNEMDRLTSRQVEQVTEHFRERIYATITLIALLVTLWQSTAHITARGAALSVFGTVVALWLAVGISSRMSYQMVNGKRMSIGVYTGILKAHAALLVPAFPVLLLIGVSALGVFTLDTALFSSMIILLLSFAGFSIIAGRKIHSNLFDIVVTSAFETALGVGVIILKIVAGH
jgi:hypothetical protein